MHHRAQHPPDIRQVLVVDDSPAARESASAFLTDAGYTVYVACDGFEGLASVEQNRPDIVVADIMMPGIDGYQMCALMKSNPDYRQIPVIMLTGKDALVDEGRAELVGSDAHLSKPFSALAITGAISAFDTSSPDNSQ